MKDLIEKKEKFCVDILENFSKIPLREDVEFFLNSLSKETRDKYKNYLKELIYKDYFPSLDDHHTADLMLKIKKGTIVESIQKCSLWNDIQKRARIDVVVFLFHSVDDFLLRKFIPLQILKPISIKKVRHVKTKAEIQTWISVIQGINARDSLIARVI